MTTTGVVGSVAGLWRFPVKSMSGERLEQAELSERGILGDRAYALIDADALPVKSPAGECGAEAAGSGKPSALRRRSVANVSPPL